MTENHFIILKLLTALLGSAVLTGVVKKYAPQLNLIDLPNERSLHSIPKPRGGGLGIVLFSLLGICFLKEDGLLLYFTLSCGLVAVVGLWDDASGVAVRYRFLAHSMATGIFLLGLQLSPVINVGNVTLEGNWIWALAFLFIVWMLNLYNFMDGIDGLAAAQAVTSGAFLAIIALLNGAFDLAAVYLAILFASLGFLTFNWPPAKIFMGDLGSGFLGFTFAALAVYGELTKGIPLVSFLIVFAIFISDSGVTLLRRTVRRVPIHHAHREHAYQKLVQQGYTHRQVTTGIMFINCFWLGSLAIASVYFPSWQLMSLLLAYLPIIWFCYRSGAGLPAPSKQSFR